jgi:recombinational DNA repair ATPase RecF
VRVSVFALFVRFAFWLLVKLHSQCFIALTGQRCRQDDAASSYLADLAASRNKASQRKYALIGVRRVNTTASVLFNQHLSHGMQHLCIQAVVTVAVL